MELLSFLDWGIAVVFAVAMFLIYRKTCAQMRDDRKYMEDRLSGIIESTNKSISDFTKVVTELTVWLKTRNGHK